MTYDNFVQASSSSESLSKENPSSKSFSSTEERENDLFIAFSIVVQAHSRLTWGKSGF